MKGNLLVYTHFEEMQKYFPNLDMKKILPHLAYTFAIENISRACSHQLIRHRTASFSQQSQRYIAIKKLDKSVVIPLTVKKKILEKFNSLIEDIKDLYQELVNIGVPREDARFILPNATWSSLLMTIDGQSLFHFFGIRCCNRSQWEIRELAKIMLSNCRKVEKEIFRHAGPYCYMLGYCPEGKFTCGKIKETKARYKLGKI